MIDIGDNDYYSIYAFCYPNFEIILLDNLRLAGSKYIVEIDNKNFRRL